MLPSIARAHTYFTVMLLIGTLDFSASTTNPTFDFAQIPELAASVLTAPTALTRGSKRVLFTLSSSHLPPGYVLLIVATTLLASNPSSRSLGQDCRPLQPENQQTIASNITRIVFMMTASVRDVCSCSPSPYTRPKRVWKKVRPVSLLALTDTDPISLA